MRPAKLWYRSKIVLLSLAMFVLGFADFIGVIDLKPLLVLLGVPEEKTQGVAMMVSLAFALLRYVTSGQVTLRRMDEGE